MAKSPRTSTDEMPSDDNFQHESHESREVTQNGEPLTGAIATVVKSGAKRAHKATFATDKRNGGYLVRVIGPHANAFGGKIVPVVKRDDSETMEELGRVVWFGIDTGTEQQPGTGKPVALYTFIPKGRSEGDEPLF
jgi:hypothetical protein